MEIIYIIVGSICTLGGVFITDLIRFRRENEKEKREVFAKLFAMEDILLLNLKKYFDLASRSNHQEKLEEHRIHSQNIIGKVENYLMQSYLIQFVEKDPKLLEIQKLYRKSIHQFHAWFLDLETHIQMHISEIAKMEEFENRVMFLRKHKKAVNIEEQEYIKKEIEIIKEYIANIKEWDKECDYLNPKQLKKISEYIDEFRESTEIWRKAL